MLAYPRHATAANDEVGAYHCIARCVRRAFLCGADPVTGHDYEHRKDWIRERLEHLASIFGIDICGYLPIGLDTYLSLVDWTGRQIRGTIRPTSHRSWNGCI